MKFVRKAQRYLSILSIIALVAGLCNFTVLAEDGKVKPTFPTDAIGVVVGDIYITNYSPSAIAVASADYAADTGTKNPTVYLYFNSSPAASRGFYNLSKDWLPASGNSATHWVGSINRTQENKNEAELQAAQAIWTNVKYEMDATTKVFTKYNGTGDRPLKPSGGGSLVEAKEGSPDIGGFDGVQWLIPGGAPDATLELDGWEVLNIFGDSENFKKGDVTTGGALDILFVESSAGPFEAAARLTNTEGTKFAYIGIEKGAPSDSTDVISVLGVTELNWTGTGADTDNPYVDAIEVFGETEITAANIAVGGGVTVTLFEDAFVTQKDLIALAENDDTIVWFMVETQAGAKAYYKVTITNNLAKSQDEQDVEAAIALIGTSIAKIGLPDGDDATNQAKASAIKTYLEELAGMIDLAVEIEVVAEGYQWSVTVSKAEAEDTVVITVAEFEDTNPPPVFKTVWTSDELYNYQIDNGLATATAGSATDANIYTLETQGLTLYGNPSSGNQTELRNMNAQLGSAIVLNLNGDKFEFTKRLSFRGTSNYPTTLRNVVAFDVNGDSEITVVGVSTNSGGTVSTIQVSKTTTGDVGSKSNVPAILAPNGTGEYEGKTVLDENNILTCTYTGDATTLYVGFAGAASDIYYISATNVKGAVAPNAGAKAELANYSLPTNLALADGENEVSDLINAIKATNATPDEDYDVEISVALATDATNPLDDTDKLAVDVYRATITVTETGNEDNKASKHLLLNVSKLDNPDETVVDSAINEIKKATIVIPIASSGDKQQALEEAIQELVKDIKDKNDVGVDVEVTFADDVWTITVSKGIIEKKITVDVTFIDPDQVVVNEAIELIDATYGSGDQATKLELLIEETDNKEEKLIDAIEDLVKDITGVTINSAEAKSGDQWEITVSKGIITEKITIDVTFGTQNDIDVSSALNLFKGTYKNNNLGIVYVEGGAAASDSVKADEIKRLFNAVEGISELSVNVAVAAGTDDTSTGGTDNTGKWVVTVTKSLSEAKAVITVSTFKAPTADPFDGWEVRTITSGLTATSLAKSGSAILAVNTTGDAIINSAAAGTNNANASTVRSNANLGTYFPDFGTSYPDEFVISVDMTYDYVSAANARGLIMGLADGVSAADVAPIVFGVACGESDYVIRPILGTSNTRTVTSTVADFNTFGAKGVAVSGANTSAPLYAAGITNKGRLVPQNVAISFTKAASGYDVKYYFNNEYIAEMDTTTALTAANIFDSKFVVATASGNATGTSTVENIQVKWQGTTTYSIAGEISLGAGLDSLTTLSGLQIKLYEDDGYGNTSGAALDAVTFSQETGGSYAFSQKVPNGNYLVVIAADAGKYDELKVPVSVSGANVTNKNGTLDLASEEKAVSATCEAVLMVRRIRITIADGEYLTAASFRVIAFADDVDNIHTSSMENINTYASTSSEVKVGDAVNIVLYDSLGNELGTIEGVVLTAY